MSAHIFVGQDSKITNVYKAKANSSAEFLRAFQDRVRERGVPTKLIADNCPTYRGWNTTKYLRNLVVSLWQCETKHQNQNLAENQYQTVKRHIDRTMDRNGAPLHPGSCVWCTSASVSTTVSTQVSVMEPNLQL